MVRCCGESHPAFFCADIRFLLAIFPTPYFLQHVWSLQVYVLVEVNLMFARFENSTSQLRLSMFLISRARFELIGQTTAFNNLF